MCRATVTMAAKPPSMPPPQQDSTQNHSAWSNFVHHNTIGHLLDIADGFRAEQEIHEDHFVHHARNGVVRYRDFRRHLRDEQEVHEDGFVHQARKGVVRYRQTKDGTREEMQGVRRTAARREDRMRDWGHAVAQEETMMRGVLMGDDGSPIHHGQDHTPPPDQDRHQIPQLTPSVADWHDRVNRYRRQQYGYQQPEYLSPAELQWRDDLARRAEEDALARRAEDEERARHREMEREQRARERHLERELGEPRERAKGKIDEWRQDAHDAKKPLGRPKVRNVRTTAKPRQHPATLPIVRD